MDTGSLAGDFISSRAFQTLNLLSVRVRVRVRVRVSRTLGDRVTGVAPYVLNLFLQIGRAHV